MRLRLPTRSASTSVRTVSPVSAEISVANCTRVPSNLLSLLCPAKIPLTHLDAPAVPFANAVPSPCSSVVLGPAFTVPEAFSSSSGLSDCEGKGLSLSEDLEQPDAPLYSDRGPFVCFCWPILWCCWEEGECASGWTTSSREDFSRVTEDAAMRMLTFKEHAFRIFSITLKI